MLSGPGRMRVLEARFYPDPKNRRNFVRVGNLIWEGRHPSERPLCQPAEEPTSKPLVPKLLGLLGMMKPDCFVLLRTLRSVIWSFVDVSAAPRKATSVVGQRP